MSVPREHDRAVTRAVFSVGGTRVATASEQTARLWDAATGQPRTFPLEHDDIVNSAVFSPDGTRVVTASEDQTARVWDATAGKLLLRPLAAQDGGAAGLLDLNRPRTGPGQPSGTP